MSKRSKETYTRLKPIESILILGDKGQCMLKAKVDTGADRTSIADHIAEEIGLPTLPETVKVKGEKTPRHLTDAKLQLIRLGESYKVKASLKQRKNMDYPVLNLFQYREF